MTVTPYTFFRKEFAMRGYFFVYKRTLKSGKKVYYYQTYKPDGTLSSGKSTGCRTKSAAIHCQRQAILTITSQEKIAKISQKETATIIIKQKFLKYVLTNNAQKRRRDKNINEQEDM